MSNSNKLIIALVVLIILLISLVIIGKKQGWIGQGKAVKVTIEEVQKNSIIETVSASGKIYPEIEVKLSPDVSGEITDLYIDEGDSVKSGQLLLSINPDIYHSIVERTEAAVNQAKANLANTKARYIQVFAQFENANTVFERNTKLFQQQVISKSEFETATTAHKTSVAEEQAGAETVRAAEFSVKSSEAALKEARDNLVKTKIYAPISGTVSLLSVEKGERVVGTSQMPGTEIMRIADFNKMEVRVDVGENDVLKVTIGDTAEIEVDAYLNRKFLGVVSQISNSASFAMQLSADQVTNFTVKIRLLPESYKDIMNLRRFPFRPGMSASVEVQTEKSSNILTVPIQCVTVREDMDDSLKTKKADKYTMRELVFLYQDGQAVLREVETGIQDIENIEIKSGLDIDDQVITGPYRAISRLLDDGDPVTIVSEEELKSENETE